MIEELKLFATALKMGAAFLSIDKLALKWIEQDYQGRAWRDLNPKELEEDEKREWYDLHDSWERANKDLRGKLLRFEQDPYSQGASPILRYERNVDQYGVKGKLFLGLNSHQAKGYRIIELDHPRWLEQLMQSNPDVFRSENLSEGEVYALVPSRGIDQEKLSVLNSDYFEDLEKAGVPAFDTFKGYKELKPEFISRFNKTVDTRLPFDANVLRVQALVEAIKREHALAVPITRAVATKAPSLPPIPKAIEAAKRPAPKYTKNQEVRYQGATYLILDSAFQNGEWLYELNAPGVSLFKPEKEIQKLLEQPLLSIYTVPGVRFVEGFEDSGAAFRKADEMRRQFPGSVYHVVKPDVLQHKLHPFEVWLVNRGYEVPDKIRVAEPIKTVSTPLYTTAHVAPPITPEEAKEEAKLEKEAEKEVEQGKIIEEEIEQIEGPELVKPSSWKKGMPLTDQQIEDAKMDAIGAIENFHVPKTALLYYDQRGREAAIGAIKENLNSWGMGGPDIPDLQGTTKGIWVTNDVMTPANAASASPSDAKLITWGELLDFILANRNMIEENIREREEKKVPSVPAAAAPTDAEVDAVYMEILKEVADRGYAFQDAITFKTNIARGDSDLFKRIIKVLLDSGDVIETSPGSGVYKTPAAAKPTTPTPQPTKPTPTTPTPQPPRPTKILSSEDMRLLQDYWNTQFIRAIGKVPAGFSSVFRIEFQEVKTMPFAEAKTAILAAADREIEGIELAQRARAVIRQGERIRPGVPLKAPPGRREEVPVGEEEERLPLATGRVTPSAFPINPLSVMQPFPRGPTSLEQLRLWKVFCYEMQQEGYDCNPYAKDFAEYIGKSQFLSWEDLRQRFEFFENTIMEGATLPPLVQWRAKLTTPTGLRGELQELEPSPEPAKLTTQQIEDEEKNAVRRQRILISHWAAALIHQARYYNRVKTMSDLYDEVVSRGVIDASIPEEIFLPIAKEAIREVYSQKLRPVEFVKTDGEEEEVEKLNLAKVPYVDISQQEIDEFLASG